MTRAAWRVTYETITPESAEQGDAEERGFASPGGWKHDDPTELGLKDAIGTCGLYARGHGTIGGFEDCGRWFSTCDAEPNYQTGANTYYSLHPPEGITGASYRRVRRIVCGR